MPLDRAPHMVALARERVHAVTSISALHHVELAQVLPRLAEALRPGGLLIAIALPMVDLPRDLPVEALSAVAHRLSGGVVRVEQAARVLPGAQVRRLLFWRYELRWHRPVAT